MLLLENKDFREFVGFLNSNRVRFLIVGGHAVAFHGYVIMVRVGMSRKCGFGVPPQAVTRAGVTLTA